MTTFEESRPLSRSGILSDGDVEETLHDALSLTRTMFKEMRPDSLYTREEAILHFKMLTDSLKTIVESICLFQETNKK